MLMPLKLPITIHQRCDFSDCLSVNRGPRKTRLMYIWVDNKRDFLTHEVLRAQTHRTMFLQSEPLYTRFQKLLMDSITRLFRIQILSVLNSAHKKLNYKHYCSRMNNITLESVGENCQG